MPVEYSKYRVSPPLKARLVQTRLRMEIDTQELLYTMDYMRQYRIAA